MSPGPSVAPVFLLPPTGRYYDNALHGQEHIPSAPRVRPLLLLLLLVLTTVLLAVRIPHGSRLQSWWLMRAVRPVGMLRSHTPQRHRGAPLLAMEDRAEDDPLKQFANAFRRVPEKESAIQQPLPIPRMRDYLRRLSTRTRHAKLAMPEVRAARAARAEEEKEEEEEDHFEVGFSAWSRREGVDFPREWEEEPDAVGRAGEKEKAEQEADASSDEYADAEDGQDGEKSSLVTWPETPPQLRRDDAAGAEGSVGSELTVYSVADVPVPRNSLDEEVLRDDWAPLTLPPEHRGTIPFFMPPVKPPFEYMQVLPPSTVIPLLRLDDVAPDRTNLTGNMLRVQMRKPITILRVRHNGKVSAGQYRVTTNHMAREVTDPRIRDLFAKSIRNLTIYFLEDRKSPFWRLAGPTVSLFRNDEVFLEHIVPIEFPEHWGGLKTLPSKAAFAVYHRGYPHGVVVIIDRLVDFGDYIELAVFLKTEHESVRTTMLGRGKRTYKMLKAFLTQQLSVQFQMPVVVNLGIVPLVSWAKKVGGINYFTVEENHAPSLSWRRSSQQPLQRRLR